MQWLKIMPTVKNSEKFPVMKREVTEKVMSASQMASRFGKEALEKIVKLMRHSNNETTQLAAAQVILNRAYGLPVAQTKLLDDNNNAVTPQIILQLGGGNASVSQMPHVETIDNIDAEPVYLPAEGDKIPE